MIHLNLIVPVIEERNLATQIPQNFILLSKSKDPYSFKTSGFMEFSFYSVNNTGYCEFNCPFKT